MMRNVERNVLRANFVEAAEEWQWGAAYFRSLSKAKKARRPDGLSIRTLRRK